MLCENPWEGGAGYTPQQVADMTPDQIYFRLCDKDLLKDERKKSVSTEAGGAVKFTDSDGMMKGRLADGTVVRMPMAVGGKSLAQRLREEAEKKQSEGGRKDKQK